MRKSKKEHTYWGNAARTYDADTAYIVGEETQREIECWLSSQFKATDEVLELGCGTGHCSMVIAGEVRHLTATDGSLEMLEQARTRLHPLTHVDVLREDCYHTSFADGIFDVVFLGNVIHILTRPIDVLRESHRVLKERGHIVLVDFTSYGMTFWSKFAMGIRYLKKFGIPPKENRIVGPDQVARWIETAGFLVEASRLIEKETRAVCVRAKKA